MILRLPTEIDNEIFSIKENSRLYQKMYNSVNIPFIFATLLSQNTSKLSFEIKTCRSVFLGASLVLNIVVNLNEINEMKF